MQDDDLFASEMSGVTPLKREPRERLVKTEAVDVSQRRQAATQSGARSDNHLSDDGVPPLDAWYVLEFKRPGIQNGVYRKLRLVITTLKPVSIYTVLRWQRPEPKSGHFSKRRGDWGYEPC